MKTSLLPLFGVLLLLSCSKGESKTEWSYFFSATVNGQTLSYEAKDANSRYVCGASSVYNTVNNEYEMYEGSYIADNEGGARNKIYVHVMQRSSTYQLTQAQRLALFRVGSYAYGKRSEGSGPTLNGATVQYTDENGVTWYSEGGPQEGSTFTITEISNDPVVTSAKTFKANFNCRLYAWDGSSIQFINGKFCGRIVSP